MKRLGIGLVVATAVALAAVSSSAVPPQINGISPFGVQRGVTTEVTVAGTNLAGAPKLIAPFGLRVEPNPTPNKDASKWTFKLTADPRLALGTYLVRVLTEEGLSNPFLFAVGQAPQVAEKEDNGDFSLAQEVPSFAVVEGQAAGNDVDYFRFKGKKGDRIVVDAQCARIGSGVDPSIRLTTASRTFVASADDTPGLLTDARLTATLPEDGDYVVELSDSRYQGGARPIYRLLIGPAPVAEEVYPLGGRSGETIGIELRGGTIGETQIAAATLRPEIDVERMVPRVTGASVGAGPLDVESIGSIVVDSIPELRESSDASAPPVTGVAPVVFNGRLEAKGDEDSFNLSVTPGKRYRVEVQASSLGSAMDGVLRIQSSTGSLITTSDDTSIAIRGKAAAKKEQLLSPDPSTEFTAPSGQTEVTLKLRDIKGDGGLGYPYRIKVTPVGPTFELELTDGQVNVPKGGAAAIAVTAVRKGHNGPISLVIPNPPAGITVRPGFIPEGQTTGVLTLSATPEANCEGAHIDVVGQADAAGVTISSKARKLHVFAQQATLPTNVVDQVGMPVATTKLQGVGLIAPDAPVQVAHGQSAAVKIAAARAKGAEAALALAALAPPQGVVYFQGLTAAAGTIPEKAAEGAVTINAAPDAPLGKSTFVLTAKGKLDGKDQTLTVPAVTVEVVRPVSLELPAATEIKASATVELKGKLNRIGGFKEPVTLKLEGLPAGLKADPVTVAPDKAEFAFKIVADPKAAAASAAAKVSYAFQVAKKAYTMPPGALTVKVLPAK